MKLKILKDIVLMTSGPQITGHIESDRPAYYVIGFLRMGTDPNKDNSRHDIRSAFDAQHHCPT